MKKRIFLLIALIICLGLLFASCDALSDIFKFHTHHYQWVDNGDGTHVKHCTNNGCDEPDINSGAHDWSKSNTCVCGAIKPTEQTPPSTDTHSHDYQWVVNADGTHVKHCANDGCDEMDIDSGAHQYSVVDTLPATCAADGWAKYECSDCKYTYTDTLYQVDHTSDGTVYYDSDNPSLGHWQLCKFGCGTKLNVSAHTTALSANIDATCTEHAKDVYTCSGCQYTYTVEDNTSALTGHTYQAYVCVDCQQDMLSEYVDQFDLHGKTGSDPVTVDSKLKLTLYVDYMIFYGVFNEARYIDIAYVDANTDSEVGLQLLRTELMDAIKMQTAGSICLFRLGYLSSSSTISLTLVDDQTTVATYTPDANGYGKQIYSQAYSPAFDKYSAVRADGFDDFKYKQRTHTASVSTSDQLFYAFEHGYLPQPVAGSTAERILNKAKAVARRIMDDGMTDVEKLNAIYLWLTEEVYYDYGALELELDNNDWHTVSAYYLEGVFDYGIAVCDGISKAYCVLAGIEDITCVRVTGEIANGGGHAWNKVLVDADGDGTKEWFASDATWGNTLIKSGQSSVEMLNMQYFLTTDYDRSKRIETFYSYIDSDCDATTKTNSFEYFFFGGESSNDNDFVIESSAELTALMKYIAQQVEQTGVTEICFTMYFADSYCTTSQRFSSEVRNAINNTNLSASVASNFSEYDLDGQTVYLALIYLNCATD